MASCPLRPARGCGRPAQADPHTHQPPSGNSQKTAKSAIPHLAGHTLQPMPRRSPCASDPHTGHVPTRFHGSPIQPPCSQNPDIGFGKTSVSGPANQASAGLHELPASSAGAVPHVRTGHQSVAARRRIVVTASGWSCPACPPGGGLRCRGYLTPAMLFGAWLWICMARATASWSMQVVLPSAGYNFPVPTSCFAV